MMWKLCLDKDQKIKWPFWCLLWEFLYDFMNVFFEVFCVPNTMSPHWIPESAMVGTETVSPPQVLLTGEANRLTSAKWDLDCLKNKKRRFSLSLLVRFLLEFVCIRRVKQFNSDFPRWSPSLPPLHSNHLRCWRSQCWEHQNVRFECENDNC